MKYMFLDIPCVFLNNSLRSWFLQFTERLITKKWQHFKMFAILVNKICLHFWQKLTGYHLEVALYNFSVQFLFQ